MIKKLAFVLSFSLLTCLVSAQEQNKILPVSTSIDKSKLYPYSLTVELPSSIFLLYFLTNENRFKDVTSSVFVTSTIPEDESAEFGYTLQLTENKSICRNIIGDTEKSISGIMNVFIDDNEIIEGESSPIKPLSELNEDGYRFGESSLLLRSDVIEEEGMECSGKVTLLAEVAL